MKRLITCDCGQAFKTAEAAGKASCPGCGKRISFATDNDETVPSAKRSSWATSATFYRLPLYASLVWLPLAIDLALLSPRLWSLPLLVNWVYRLLPLLVTVALAVWCFAAAVHLLGITGRTISTLPLSGTLICLFGLFFFQVACHLGADHFSWDSLPRPWDWGAFLLAHTVRAGDVPDALESYGIKLQVLQHNGTTLALVLIIYHVIVDLFILSLFVDAVESVKRRVREQSADLDVPRLMFFSCIAFVAIWLFFALYLRPWRKVDLLLWPVDNLLRVLDFADALELFHVHIHQVPKNFVNNSLTFVFRLSLTLALVNVIAIVMQAIKLRWLGGIGISTSELKSIQANHPTKQVQKLARQRLKFLRENKRNEAVPSAAGGWLPQPLGTALIIWLALAVTPAFFLMSWRGPVRHVVEVALGNDADARDKACTTLARLGPLATGAAPLLNEGSSTLSDDRQIQLVRVFGRLGLEGVPSLRRLFGGTNVDLASRSVDALAESGARVAPEVAIALNSPRRAVRAKALMTLRRFGRDAVQPLLDRVVPENAYQLMPLISELDPRWEQRNSSNPRYHELLDTRRQVRVLIDAQSELEELKDAVAKITSHGPIATEAFAALKYRQQSQSALTGELARMREGYMADDMAFRKSISDAYAAIMPPVAVEQLAWGAADGHLGDIQTDMNKMVLRAVSDDTAVPRKSSSSLPLAFNYERSVFQIAVNQDRLDGLIALFLHADSLIRQEAESVLASFEAAGFFFSLPYSDRIALELVTKLDGANPEIRDRTYDFLAHPRSYQATTKSKLLTALRERQKQAKPAELKRIDSVIGRLQ